MFELFQYLIEVFFKKVKMVHKWTQFRNKKSCTFLKFTNTTFKNFVSLRKILRLKLPSCYKVIFLWPNIWAMLLEICSNVIFLFTFFAKCFLFKLKQFFLGKIIFGCESKQRVQLRQIWNILVTFKIEMFLHEFYFKFFIFYTQLLYIRYYEGKDESKFFLWFALSKHQFMHKLTFSLIMNFCLKHQTQLTRPIFHERNLLRSIPLISRHSRKIWMAVNFLEHSIVENFV